MRNKACLNFFMKKAPYNHPFLSYEDLAVLLIQRGMSGSASVIKQKLMEVGYQRLSAYWLPFTDSKGNIPVDFGYVWQIYCFDRQIRALLLDAIERIEVAVRNRLVHYFAEEHGTFGYLKQQNFPQASTSDWQAWHNKQQHAALSSKSKMVVDFFNTYSDKDLPVWIACELMDFGSTVFFYGSVEQKIQKRTARSFNINNPKILHSWLRSLNDIRNACAHHNRVWNRAWVKQPKIPTKDRAWAMTYNTASGQWESPTTPHNSSSLIKSGFDLTKTGIMLTICQNLLVSIDPQNDWKNKLSAIIATPAYSRIVLSWMGMPKDWATHPLWQ